LLGAGNIELNVVNLIPYLALGPATTPTKRNCLNNPCVLVIPKSIVSYVLKIQYWFQIILTIKIFVYVQKVGMNVND
jgi:hypothetical protein